MAGWKDQFFKYASVIEERFDDLSFDLKRKLKLNDPVQIVPYRSYGTHDRLYVKGRILEDKKIAISTDRDTILNNLLNMYKRFESDEVPGARLRVTFEDKEHHVTSDDEGYFVLNLKPTVPVYTENLWHQVHLQLLEAPIPIEGDVFCHAEVLIPPEDAEYGIISDLDDTVVKTGATDFLAMSRTVFLNNSRTRLPFAGVAEFYKSLQLGRNGKRNNPFFYVSSSPWNMYDLLKDFLDLNQIPAGPLLLRDFGLERNSVAGTDHMGHKFHEIKQILETYPRLNFVLVGDSGQEDATIYREVVKEFPGRILAIYIRDVQVPERRQISVKISEELTHHKVEMIIVDNTVEAADHAAKTGLIFREAIPVIEEDKQEDKGQKPGKEDATVTG
jgi:phosphatidate phosphatase APP1